MLRVRYYFNAALAFALVLATTGAARAADDAHKKGDTHGGGGPSVLDIFAGAIDLAIWTIVVFVILLFLLSKYAWKPMLEGLRKREESIKGAVEEAKVARAETQRMQAEFQKKLDEAHQQIPKLLEEARRDAQQLAEEMRAKANADIAAERQRLRREIETATDQALQTIWTKTADIAAEIAGKAIRRALTEDDQRRLVEEAMSELRVAGEARLRERDGART